MVTKICTKCKIEKNVLDFGVRRRAKDGRKHRCRMCTNEDNRWPSSEALEKYKKLKSERTRDKTYGLQNGEYDQMYQQQQGLCRICGEAETRKSPKSNKPLDLLVDHNHETNKTRALLCHRCNTALGLFREKSELCYTAAKYLIAFDEKMKPQSFSIEGIMC